MRFQVQGRKADQNNIKLVVHWINFLSGPAFIPEADEGFQLNKKKQMSIVTYVQGRTRNRETD